MMAIGKKLLILACYASALLLVGIVAPAIYSLVDSGQPLCVPRLSIRCHESDCESFFQRCGSTELLRVPDHKVCYKGALLPSSRTDLHSCPSTTLRKPHNSSGSDDHVRSSGLGACNCNLCTYPQSCQCFCTQGKRVESAVTCENTPYPSLAMAMSKGVPAAHCSEVPRRPMWEMALETLQRHYESGLSIGQWSLQDFAASFTFQKPSLANSDHLQATCKCPISEACKNACTG
ncbi:unnamed protein product [Calypogeia fissa]